MDTSSQMEEVHCHVLLMQTGTSHFLRAGNMVSFIDWLIITILIISPFYQLLLSFLTFYILLDQSSAVHQQYLDPEYREK